MKNERFFVVLAVAVCTFMGTLLAVEISSRFAYGVQYLWAFGALLGGIVGGSVFGAFAYCAVDFQNFWYRHRAFISQNHRVAPRPTLLEDLVHFFRWSRGPL